MIVSRKTTEEVSATVVAEGISAEPLPYSAMGRDDRCLVIVVRGETKEQVRRRLGLFIGNLQDMLEEIS